MVSARYRAFYLSFASLFLLVACTARQAIEQPKPTSFISHRDELAKPPNTPFTLAWAAPKAEASEYARVIVAAVRTDYLQTSNWVFRAGTLIPTREDYLNRVEQLAEYIQRTVTQQFEEHDKPSQDVVVEKADPVQPRDTGPPENQGSEPLVEPMRGVVPTRTLVIELSIAEANFGDPIIYGGLLAVPVPAVANLSTAVKSPSLTLEARMVDQETGDIVTELVDRRFPQIKIVDINRLTIASALRELADSFAEDLVKSFYRKKGEKICDRLPFSLLPW